MKFNKHWKTGFAKIKGEQMLAIASVDIKDGDSGPMICVISEKSKMNNEDIVNAQIIAAAPKMLYTLVELYKERMLVSERGYSNMTHDKVIKTIEEVFNYATDLDIREVLDETKYTKTKNKS